MDEASVISGLVDNRSRIHSFALFHRSLRELGMKAMTFINGKRLGDPRRQFVAAALVSCREIDLEDLNCISDAHQKLNNLQQTDEDLTVHDHYLLLNRVVILPNLLTHNIKNSLPHKIHGEARLLDPDCKLRNGDCNVEYASKKNRHQNVVFLEQMRQKFYSIYHKSEKYIICMFSFYIPCTISDFTCAELICKFATEQNEQIIISYEKVHDSTNLKLSRTCMKNCDNVYYIDPKDLLEPSRDVLDITEYRRIFPQCQRIERRYRKRNSKFLLNREEKKKRETWTRDKFCRTIEFHEEPGISFVELRNCMKKLCFDEILTSYV